MDGARWHRIDGMTLEPMRSWTSVVERAERLILTVLVTVLLFAGALYSLHLGDRLVYRDEWDYYNLATNLVERGFYTLDGQNPTAYRPPGYPWLLALFIRAGAGIPHLRIVNFLLLAVCLYLVHAIVRRETSALAATIGALLVLGYPLLFYTAGTLYPQILGSALFLGALYLLTNDRVRLGGFLAAGALFGYLVLTIPTFVFTLGIVALWCAGTRRESHGRGVALTLIVSLVVAGAWTARNYAVFDDAVFVSSNSGKNLLFGNSENTTPNAGVNADISRYTEEANRLGLNEIERDNLYTERALEYVRSHPWQSLALYGQKFLNYFNFRNELATRSEASVARDLLMLVTFGPLLSLVLVRFCLWRRFKVSPLEAFFALLYVTSGLFCAVFFTRIRFRVPFDFLIIAIVAMFLHEVIRARLRNQSLVRDSVPSGP
jgi:hypothetical protein